MLVFIFYVIQFLSYDIVELRQINPHWVRDYYSDINNRFKISYPELDYDKCDKAVCKSEGLCESDVNWDSRSHNETILSYWGPVLCSCLEQYYTGMLCNIQTTSACDKCDRHGTKNCVAYLGGAGCYCRPKYVGYLYCNFESPEGPNVPRLLALYFDHMTLLNKTSLQAILAFSNLDSFKSSDNITIEVEYKKQVFTNEDILNTAKPLTKSIVASVMSSLKNDVEIPQEYYIEVTLQTVHSGNNYISLSDDHQFQYYKVREYISCEPEVRILGLSIANYDRTYLLANRKYKNQVLGLPSCEDKDSTVDVKYYLLIEKYELPENITMKDKQNQDPYNFPTIDEMLQNDGKILIERTFKLDSSDLFYKPEKLTFMMHKVVLLARITETSNVGTRSHVDIAFFDHYQWYLMLSAIGSRHTTNREIVLKYVLSDAEDPLIMLPFPNVDFIQLESCYRRFNNTHQIMGSCLFTKQDMYLDHNDYTLVWNFTYQPQAFLRREEQRRRKTTTYFEQSYPPFTVEPFPSYPPTELRTTQTDPPPTTISDFVKKMVDDIYLVITVRHSGISYLANVRTHPNTWTEPKFFITCIRNCFEFVMPNERLKFINNYKRMATASRTEVSITRFHCWERCDDTTYWSNSSLIELVEMRTYNTIWSGFERDEYYQVPSFLLPYNGQPSTDRVINFGYTMWCDNIVTLRVFYQKPRASPIFNGAWDDSSDLSWKCLCPVNFDFFMEKLYYPKNLFAVNYWELFIGKYWKREDTFEKHPILYAHTLEFPINDTLIDFYTLMVYQKLDEIPVPVGVMISIGHTKLLRNVILAQTRASMSTFPYRLREDMLGGYDWQMTNVQFKAKAVHYSSGKTLYDQFILIEDMHQGSELTHMPSIKFNLEHKEFSQVAQKLNFMLVEKLYLVGSNYEDVHYYRSASMDMIIESLDQMVETKVDNALEVFQIYTLVESIVYAEPLNPFVPENLALTASRLLKRKAKELLGLIEQEPFFYHAHRNALREYLRPLMKTLEAFLYQPKSYTEINVEREKYKTDHIPRGQWEIIRIQEDIPVYNIFTQEIDEFLQTQRSQVSQDILVFAMDAFIRSMHLPMYTVRAFNYHEGMSEKRGPGQKEHYYPPYFHYPFDNKLKERKDPSWIREDIQIYMFAQEAKLKNFFEYKLGELGFKDVAYPEFKSDMMANTVRQENVTIQFEMAIFLNNPYWRFLWPKIIVNSVFYFMIKSEENERLSMNITMYHTIRKYIEHEYKKVESEDYQDAYVIHRGVFVSNQTPTFVYILFNKRLIYPLRVVVKLNEPPELNDFRKAKHIGNNESDINYMRYQMPKKNLAKSLIAFFIGVMPMTEEDGNYSVVVFGMKCVAFHRIYNISEYNKTATHEAGIPDYKLNVLGYWTDYGKSELLPGSMFVKCTAGSAVYVMHGVHLAVIETHLYGALTNFVLSFDPEVCYILIMTMFVLFCFFGLCFTKGYINDRSDDEEIEARYLVDNRANEHYAYLIITVTGAQLEAVTTSHVGVKLFGTLDNSKRHILQAFPENEEEFENRAVGLFVLTTKNCLGRISAVEIWLDYSGPEPSWYLEKLIVRDYNLRREWVFVVRKWFSVMHGDRKLRRYVYQTKPKSFSVFRKLINPDDFRIIHVWFGMCQREPCHAMTRKIKVLMVFTRILLAVSLMMWSLGIVELNSHALMDYGYFEYEIMEHASHHALFLVIYCCYPIGYLFSNAQPRKTETYACIDESGLDPVSLIPVYMFKYRVKLIMTTIYSVTCLACTIFIINYCFYFGIRKSQMVLVGLILYMIHDAFFAETIHLIIRNFIWRVVLQRQDVQRFCNEMINMKYQEQVRFASIKNRRKLLTRDVYYPISRNLKRIFHIKEVIYEEYEWVVNDLPSFLIHVVILIWLFTNYNDSYTYYSTRIIKLMFEGVFTNSIAFSQVRDFETLYDYLNTTLIYVLQFQKPGVLIMVNYKMLGVPRIRQLRIKETCRYVKYGFGPKLCYEPLTEETMEDGHYDYYWKPLNLSNIEDTYYHSAFRFSGGENEEHPVTSSLPIEVDRHTYPGGGYIQTLGRNWANTRSIINGLKEYHWFDINTQIVFIEISLYNSYVNLYHRVKLIVEIKSSGFVRRQVQIDSIQPFPRNDKYTNILDTCLFFFLKSILTDLLAIQIAAWVSGNFHEHAKKIFTHIEFVILLNGVVVFYLYFVRMLALEELIAEIDKSSSLIHISFDEISILEYKCHLFSGLFLAFTLCRFLCIGRFSMHVRIMEFALQNTLLPYIYLIILTLIIVLIFEILSHFIFGPYYIMYQFRGISIYRVFLFALGIMHENLQYEKLTLTDSPRFTMVIIILFIVTIKLILMSFFIGILLKSFTKANRNYGKLIISNKHLCNMHTFLRERFLKDTEYANDLRKKIIQYAQRSNRIEQYGAQLQRQYKKHIGRSLHHDVMYHKHKTSSPAGT